jgi:hypothetical protein
MSKREQVKGIEDTQKVADTTQRTLHKSLDETKENVRKSIDEARTQIPRFTNVVTHYQEQVLDSTGKMAEDYIETQKSVIDSVFNSAAPYYENANRIHDYWFSPKVPAELYTRLVSNIAENISAAARISDDILFGNIEAFGNAFERAQRHTKELSRINVDNAKTIANTARETAAEFSVNRQREVYA